MTQQIDRNAEYAIGWNAQRNGKPVGYCANQYQRHGWHEAKANKNVKPVEAPDALTDRKWAQGWGRQDAEQGEPFFPEQVGAWLRLDYAEGFHMAQPDNEACNFWLGRAYHRLIAEEYEMAWRETVIHSGGRFVGASLVEANA